MTHTVHPYAHRLGIIRDWKSRWFAADTKSYRENIKVDETIRRFLAKRLRGTYTSGIEIERSASVLRVAMASSNVVRASANCPPLTSKGASASRVCVAWFNVPLSVFTASGRLSKLASDCR